MALVPDDRKAKGLVLGASLARQYRAGRPRATASSIRSAEERKAAGQLMGELRIKAAALDQPVRYLSGGNQQKAVLAQWLLARAGHLSAG